MKPPVVFFLLLLCSSVTAQVNFSAAATPRVVSVGESLTVNFELEGAQGNDFTPPPELSSAALLKGFTVLNGPSIGRSFTIVNGKSSSSERYSYELLADREGSSTIGSASIAVGGTTYRTDPFKIVAQPRSTTSKGAAIDPDKEVQLRLDLAPDTAYVGQQVQLNIDLYSRVDIRTYAIREPIDFQGLQNEDLRNFRARERLEEIDGLRYTTQTLQAKTVYGGKPGTYALGPMIIRTDVLTGATQRRAFSFSPPTRPLVVRSDVRNLVVLPLPPGAPTDFSGAVGKWRMHGVYDDVDGVTTADAITFQLYLRGQGDPSRVQAPELAWPEGWRAYPPELTSDQSVESDSGAVHMKVYTYTVAPQAGGTFELRPEVSYFDTDSARYVTWAAPPRTVRVREVGDTFVEDIPASASVPGPYTGTPHVAKALWVERAWYLPALLGGSLGLGLLGLGLRAWRDRRARLAGQVPKRDPVAEGRRRLTAARAALDEPAVFYTEVRLALERYAEDRLGLDKSQQTDAAIRAAFAKTAGAQSTAVADAGASLADRFLDARNLADRGLYGGGTDRAGRESALGGLEVVLSA